ncbi:methylmalonyl-CoA mutase family protein, partial [Myxococcota bacterium]|nr:methylmalonyl-CoA mutase family protein [Myxococcota bacterium]
MAYRPRHPVRIVTAAALFDGHDASINIIRRLLQESGAEVIHLGHNRAAEEIVDAAIAEDAQGIAVSSYQGGHVEFFTYMRRLLNEKGSPHVRIYGGGGGVIVPREIKALEASGIDRIFSPEDGRKLGLQGMIDVIVEGCDYSTLDVKLPEHTLADLGPKRPGLVSRLVTAAEHLDLGAQGELAPGPVAVELFESLKKAVFPQADKRSPRAPIIGITGPGGAGKSSLTDELVLRYLHDSEDKTVAIISVDPTKKRTGGALLGDRIRMNALGSSRVYMRSLATRSSASELSDAIMGALRVVQAAGYDLVIVESAGTGQKDAAIAAIADVSLYVMTAEFGAQSQLEKIEMLDLADAVAINKFERRGSLDALRDVRKQYRRSRKLFEASVSDEALPVFGTIASQFNDPGVSRLYLHLLTRVEQKLGVKLPTKIQPDRLSGGGKPGIIPPKHVRYLSEIADACRSHRVKLAEESKTASRAYAIYQTLETFGVRGTPMATFGDERIAKAEKGGDRIAAELMRRYDAELARLSAAATADLACLPGLYETYGKDELVYSVRGKEIHTPLVSETLSHLKLKKVALPRYKDWGDLLTWMGTENVPGSFPFTAGVFPLKRTAEDPARMFAGEGPPEKTNARFHLLSKAQPAVRLSTAFDSVTLYGEDPHERPDIYGKVGESGVSVATVEDA